MIDANLHRTHFRFRGQVCLAAGLLALCVACSTAGNDKLGKESIPMNRLDELWDFQNPAATELRFRAFMASSEDPAFRAEALTQIARAQGLQNKFDEANTTLNEAEALIPDDTPVPRIRLLLERGRVLNSSGHPEESRASFLDAFQRAVDAKQDNYAVDAAHMLGIVEPPEDQVAWTEKALKIAESSKNPRARRWLGPLYNNLGWSYHDSGHPDQALKFFEQALAWYGEHGTPEQIRIARWAVARSLRSLGRVEEALEIQRALLVELEAAGQTDGYVFEELAECLLALGKPDEAMKYFALAYRELSQDPRLAKTEPERIERLKLMSESVGEQRQQ